MRNVSGSFLPEREHMNTLDKFRIDRRVVIITGGGGFLGQRHAKAVAEAGGLPVLWDVDEKAVSAAGRRITKTCCKKCISMPVDITNQESVRSAFSNVVRVAGRVDILINNAAKNPKMANVSENSSSRLENFPLGLWEEDIAVGLTGAFLCSQVVGSYFASRGGGVILNVSSDLGVIAPDQRIYRKKGAKQSAQPVKPVTYSVVKHALLGLTKYCATYWADKNIRVNSISPGGVYRDQPADFVRKLSSLIPMGRMASRDEYEAAVVFMISDASSYMTGANVIIDGGRTCW